MTQSATVAQPKAKKNKLSSGFFRFVLTRFLLIIPTVFILVTIVFFVMRATGDPISAALGGRLTPEELQKRIHAAGYDRPLVVQYIDYLNGLLHGDLGTTLTDNQKVITILTRYGAATFELAFLALIVALIVGIGLGSIAARKRDRAADAGIRTFAILCYATPVFFLGLILKLIFAIWMNVLGITLVGESLNDLADPRLRARKSAGEVVGSIEDTSVDPNEKPGARNEVMAELAAARNPMGAIDAPVTVTDHDPSFVASAWGSKEGE